MVKRPAEEELGALDKRARTESPHHEDEDSTPPGTPAEQIAGGFPDHAPASPTGSDINGTNASGYVTPQNQGFPEDWVPLSPEHEIPPVSYHVSSTSNARRSLFHPTFDRNCKKDLPGKDWNWDHDFDGSGGAASAA